MATNLSDLQHAARLTKEEVSLESDLVQVFHPSGGVNVERVMSIADLRALVSSTMTGATGASVFMYKADTQSQSVSDPGTGKMRWNNATQISSTRLIFDWITTDGFDPVLMFQSVKIGDTIIVQDADLSVNYQVWRKTAPGVNMPDWFYVDVEFVSSNGNAQFKPNSVVAVLVQVGEKIVSSAGQVIRNKAGNLVGEDTLVFDGKTLRMPAIPTSAAGLPSGSLWNNAGVLNVVP